MWIGRSTALRCEWAFPIKFAHQIEFADLRLYENERIQIGTTPVDRRRSSLIGGTLYLDALNAKAISLRPFEDLVFGASNGYIRSLSIPADPQAIGDELHLQAHAKVQKMKLGSGPNQRSPMPTWLELLAAQTGIALLWAFVIYIFGVVYTVLRWFKVAD
jgi:hypothetical protein